MRKYARLSSALLPAALLLAVQVGFAVEEKTSWCKGTVTKIDQGAKTVAVKTKDGTVHTLHFVGRTTVHGVDATGAGAKDAFHGLKEGSEVVAHYSSKGAVETAEEVDHIGKDGLKVSEGAVTHIDRGGKVLVVKTASGGEETFRLADHAAADAGKDIAEGAEKSGKVTVYYTEEAGRKVAHFFEKAF